MEVVIQLYSYYVNRFGKPISRQLYLNGTLIHRPYKSFLDLDLDSVGLVVKL